MKNNFELYLRVELRTSSLPRKCSTTELIQQRKSGKRGSNPRPPAWKASALSTELFPLVSTFKVGGDGFEPPKASPADLQSAPFGHSGNHPYFNCLSALRHSHQLSLLSDSNQRPRDYKSRALAN